MKKILVLAAAAVLGITTYAKSSTPAGFTDDLEAAINASKTSGKTVLAVFSGSDWCHWCKVLEKDYLSKSEFVEVASQRFELVFIDSPRDKSVLSEKAKANNDALTKKYGIRGFPTLKFIDSEGKATDAPRAGGNVSPKDYATKLINYQKIAPIIAQHITPVEREYQKLMMSCMKVMRAEGDYFAKATEQEQRSGFDKTTKAVTDTVTALNALIAKFEAEATPSEVAENKAELIKQMKDVSSNMKRFADATFEDVLKEYKGMLEKSKKADKKPNPKKFK